MFLQWLYHLVTVLLVPLAFIKLAWRSRKHADYRERWGERIAWRMPHFSKPVIWLHAVSVGETIAAKPLIEALLAQYGADYEILITNGTVTGSACSQRLFGARIKHCYLPYDMQVLTSRFVSQVKPVLAMMMETEVWPNLQKTLSAQKIPTLLVNARLSAKSERAYLRLAGFFQPVFAGFACIAAQAPEDATRFKRVGASNVKVVGNLKYNVQVPEDIHAQAAPFRQLCPGQKIWLAASTHEGEETLILAAFAVLQRQFPDLRLWLAPRHPDRCGQVAKMALATQASVCLRSQLTAASVVPGDAVVIIDTLGELLLFYAMADFTFVGGSLIIRGGHNILEPAAVGTPIMTGPNMYNFATITEQFNQAGAMLTVNNTEEIVQAVTRLLTESELATNLSERATACFLAEQQALNAHMQIIQSFL